MEMGGPDFRAHFYHGILGTLLMHHLGLLKFSQRDNMPIYQFQCVECLGEDQLVAGCDDHTALCTRCGGLMLRLYEAVYRPYFEEVLFQPSVFPLSKTSN
jgi:hypothetical protein